MLALPEAGMAYSVGAHNVNPDYLCDWIEASAVFSRDRLSKSDVIDALVENEVYEEQDFASQIVDDAWSTLGRRLQYQHSPLGLQVEGNRIIRSFSWDTFPSYAFCLLLACAPLYPSWARGWGVPHSVHGNLFEELTEESVRHLFSGWRVRRVGWSPENKAKLKDTIEGIISELNEVAGSEIDLHVDIWNFLEKRCRNIR